MAAPAYRTVVWEPPLSPGVVPDVLAWPDMFLGAQISCSLDMSALPDTVDIAVATAWPTDLLIGSPAINDNVLTVELGGGSVNAYVVTFILFLSNGDTLPVQVQIEALQSDLSAISGLLPPLNPASWVAFFLSLPTTPYSGRLWLNGGLVQLALGNPDPWPPLPIDQIAWTVFVSTLPTSPPAGGQRLWLNNGIVEMTPGSASPGAIVLPPESLWIAFFLTLPTTLPSEANQLWLNDGRSCLS